MKNIFLYFDPFFVKIGFDVSDYLSLLIVNAYQIFDRWRMKKCPISNFSAS